MIFAEIQILPAPPSSLSLAAKPHQRSNLMAIDEPSQPLSVPGESADDLTATNTPDPLANEQTWPTEEEMQGSGMAGPSSDNGVRTKRVPKGTSAYQAAWIMGDEGGDDEDDDEDQDSEDGMDEDGDESEMGGGLGEEEETEEIELDSRRSEVHRDLDPEQEERE